MRVSIAVPLFLLSLFAVDVAATPIPGLKQAKIARRDDLSKRDTADSPKPSKVYVQSLEEICFLENTDHLSIIPVTKLVRPDLARGHLALLRRKAHLMFLLLLSQLILVFHQTRSTRAKAE